MPEQNEVRFRPSKDLMEKIKSDAQKRDMTIHALSKSIVAKHYNKKK